MNMSRNKTVPDDIMALQANRIAAFRPDIDNLLTDFKNGAAWEALAKARQEGLVNFVATYKTLSIAIHDIQGHKTPWGACPDRLCLINRDQINAGIGLIARSSELEPKEGDNGPL